MNRVIKEGLIYLLTLSVLAILMHKDKLLENIEFALEHPYKFIHPLIYTFIVYMGIAIIRYITSRLLQFSKRK
jgi:hypothetical protein